VYWDRQTCGLAVRLHINSVVARRRRTWEERRRDSRAGQAVRVMSVAMDVVGEVLARFVRARRDSNVGRRSIGLLLSLMKDCDWCGVKRETRGGMADVMFGVPEEGKPVLSQHSSKSTKINNHHPQLPILQTQSYTRSHAANPTEAPSPNKAPYDSS